jgi:hypothetical protein
MKTLKACGAHFYLFDSRIFVHFRSKYCQCSVKYTHMCVSVFIDRTNLIAAAADALG